MRARGRDARTCRELIAELYSEDATPNDFLAAAAAAAGGEVSVLRPSHELWSRAGIANATGLTLPFPQGWLTIIPEVDVAEDTIFGHEAAHIVFGDVPHWDNAHPATRTHVTNLLGREPQDFLVSAASGAVESIWRHDDGPQERRAELLGTLLESRRRRPARYRRDRIDDFFTVRADR